MFWAILGAGPCLLAGGCASEAAPNAPPAWRLVGLYDSAALLALAQEDETPLPAAYWRPDGEMAQACGPVKHPDGLGMFEAEAIAVGRSPALVVLLQAEASASPPPPLTNKQILVSVNPSGVESFLQPMVEPRRLGLSLSWEGLDDTSGTPPEVKLVETQLRVELCMEHKTGRAWTGGSSAAVREAYLLDPPRARKANVNQLDTVILGGDRRYFVGQRTPVPAMLGPSEACVRSRAGERAEEPLRDSSAGAAAQAKGEGSLDLIPTDIWGAEIPICGARTSSLGGSYRMPLRLERSGGALPKWAEAIEQPLGVHLHKEADGKIQVDLSLNEQPLLTNEALFSTSHRQREESLLDLLAHVPVQYPRLTHPTDPTLIYTALIIPAWQLNEALGDTTIATGAREGDVLDGVGWALRHPERIAVRLGEGKDGSTPGNLQGAAQANADLPNEEERASWVNLTSGAVGDSLGRRNWGYLAGHLNSRAPILATGGREPRWTAALLARRADAQAVFLLSSAVLALIAGAGLRRVRDLWSAVPEERVTWWPTAPDASGKPPEPPPQGEA